MGKDLYLDLADIVCSFYQVFGRGFVQMVLSATAETESRK
jgi:hypothetical protein